MKFEEINRKFTAKVANYIANGYIINSATMAGHQGEISKVDLTNGSEIVRIMLDSFSFVKIDGVRGHYDGVELIIGRVTDDVRIHSDSTFDTIWNQHLEVIYQERFYQIGDNRDNKWFGTLEEAVSAYAKKYERYMNATDEVVTEFSETAKAIVLPFVKRQPKCKSVKVNDIASVKKVISYRWNGIKVAYKVTAKGNTYFLH